MGLMAAATTQADPLRALGNSKLETAVYHNPIIPGFNPDPSICRVGKDYYLVTSTFEFFPGLPIYHSRDLTNWKMAGHVLSRPEQLNLDGLGDSKGIFAPSIRYHDGTFYVVCTVVRGKGNFVVTAKDPAGPWSEPQWIGIPGIDPQLFFDDDDKVYYIGPDTKPDNQIWPQHWNIWLQEIDPETWQLTGERKTILTPQEYLDAGVQQAWLNNYEGPHLYKIKDTYYALVSHGGTGWNHAVSMWKSSKPFGPFEANPANPIVTHRDLPRETTFINSTGHADIIQTQNGEWWMVLLGKRQFKGSKEIIGRETFLVPMSWEGDFPVVNPGPHQGRVEIQYRSPDLPFHPWPEMGPRDNFDDSELSLEWNMLRTPRSTWWDLTSRPGFLQLHLRPETLAELANPSALLKRQKHLDFEASTRMVFRPEAEGEAAGMTLYRCSTGFFNFLYTLHDGKTSLVVTSRSKKDGAAVDQVLAIVPVNSEELFLKITGNNIDYDFSYSLDGKTWQIAMDNVWGGTLDQYGFTGTHVGVYATGSGNTNHTRTAAFDWFEYQAGGEQRLSLKNKGKQ